MGCISSKNSVDLDGPISIHHFNVERVIGKGGFGKVKAVTLKGEANEKWYAMKCLDKGEIVKRKSYQEVFRERDILANAKHPRICNSYFAFQDKSYLYLVMDLALGGDLRYQLNNTPKGSPFTNSQSRIYISQIVLALEYLHSINIIHRDLKPENMLMDSRGWIKLTDFGISRSLDKEGLCISSSGTEGYMAPEILVRGNVHEQIRDTAKEKSKTGVAPALSLESSTVPTMVNRHSENCIGFLRALLNADPSERIAIQEIKAHKWFTENKNFNLDDITEEKATPPFVPDLSKMNATCDADIQEVFLGSKKTSVVATDEQKNFEGYEYDYRHQKENGSILKVN